MPLNQSPRTTRVHSSIPDAASTLAALRQHALRVRARAAAGGLALIVMTALVTAAVTHTAKVDVVAVTRDLPADHILTATDITMREIASADAPRHAMTKVGQALGRRLLGPIAQPDVLSQERVAARPSARPDALDMTLSVDSATARPLAPGDKVDVWVVVSPAEGISTTGAQVAAHSVRVVAVYADRDATGAESVTLSVPAEDVPALVAARAQGAATLLTRRR